MMTAQQIFDTHQTAKRNFDAMGMPYANPFGAMSVEQIQAHLDMCAAFEREFRLSCDPGKMVGKSESGIRAEMEAKAKAHKRGAGARALVRRYGKETASKIAGRNLKG